MSLLYDPVRSLWVAKTPEEIVRQTCIRVLLARGYPKGTLAVEKSIASLMVQEGFEPDPHRRVDLLCFAPRGQDLAPLLLVECKAKRIDSAGVDQLIGYNRCIHAPFLCMATPNQVYFFWKGLRGKQEAVSFFPPYSEVLEKAWHVSPF